MLEGGADIRIAAEAPSAAYVESVGAPELIYSAEINWWLFRALRRVLRDDNPDIVFCSTTDWAQHKFAPDEEESQRHMAELDRILGEIVDDCPDREIYITADHGMSAKTDALDPGRWLTEQGVEASAIPIIKDRYVAHHGNLGGAAYIFLDECGDSTRAIALLRDAPGIEEVYTAAQAAETFKLHRDRIGDIFVLADRDTVFGELEQTHMDVRLRSHGSRHESYVPVIGYNSPWHAEDFSYNLDVGRLFLESILH